MVDYIRINLLGSHRGAPARSECKHDCCGFDNAQGYDHIYLPETKCGVELNTKLNVSKIGRWRETDQTECLNVTSFPLNILVCRKMREAHYFG